jgi:hypothetical protein
MGFQQAVVLVSKTLCRLLKSTDSLKFYESLNPFLHFLAFHISKIKFRHSGVEFDCTSCSSSGVAQIAIFQNAYGSTFVTV